MRAIRKFHTPEEIASAALTADNLYVLSGQRMGCVCDTDLGRKIIIHISSLQCSMGTPVGRLHRHA
jgi:hypothetical protein